MIMGTRRWAPLFAIVFGKRSWALAISTTSAVSMVLTGLITSRLGARNLSAEELQLWFLMLGALPFCMLLDLGAYSIVPGKMSYYGQAGEPRRVREYVATFFQTAMGTIAAVAALAALIVPWIGGRWFSAAEVGTLSMLLIVAIACRVAQNVLLGIIFAAGHIPMEKTLKTVGSIAAVAPMPFLLSHGYSVFAMPWSWLISSTFVLTIAVRHISRRITPLFDRTLFSASLSREVLGTSGKFLVAALPGMFIYNILPYRVAHDFGAALTVQIGLAAQISMGVTLLCSIPTSLLVKRIADEYFARSGGEGSNAGLIRNVRIVSVLSSGALATVFVFHEQIFQLWLGKHVPFDTRFLLLYLVAIWFEIQQTTLTTSLVSTGYVNFWRVTVLSAVLTVVTYTPFIRWFGFCGVALACLAAQLLTCHYWNTRQTLRAFGLPVLAYLRQHAISALLVALIALAGRAEALAGGVLGLLLSSGLIGLALITLFLDRRHEQGTLPRA
ncbi:hypothetical protein PV762_09765 [Mitsuaria sp. CC2]|uniref:hypothetical protein n=1 Tax=Mitsuaria sp. CC2 TaxID=3029186 RepID=UPI003B8EA745